MKEYKKPMIGLICVMLITIVTLLIGNSLAYTGQGYLSNQKIDGLSFENANIEYKNGKSTFTVEVYNENQKTYQLKNVSIEIQNSKNEKITLIGDIGNSLVSKEGKLISVTTNKDLTKLKSLKYKINK